MSTSPTSAPRDSLTPNDLAIDRQGRIWFSNPWNAGTLDWMMEIPPKEWGARSVPIVATRYPLWQQENFLDDVDNGRFMIPDAPDMRRGAHATRAWRSRRCCSRWPLVS